MGKRKWLLLFVLFSFLSVGAVVGGTNPFDYLGKTELAEVYNDQDEQKPEVKVGKPHDIEQALPKNSTSGNFRVFLGESIKNRITGAVIDADGNAIVPEGYIYSFHNTLDDANRAINKQGEIFYVDKFDPASAPITKYLRVQSVVDATKIVVSPFSIKVKGEEGTVLNDRVTGRADQYKSADENGKATFVLREDKNQFYYGNSSTELFRIGSKVALTDEEIDKFVTDKNQVIEAKIVLDGETATRQFTLYVETLKVSGVNPTIESVETRSDKDNRYGNYDLKETIPALLAAGENSDYYTITFHRTKADADSNKEALDINKPVEGAHGTDVTARISYKLAKSADPIISTKQKVKFKVIDKPTIPVLNNISYCDSNITSYSLTIDGQTKVIADGRTIATDEEMAKPNFDPKGKYSIGYFLSEEDAIANTNKIVGVEITVNLNEARKIWTRLTNLEDGNFNTAYFYASLGYDDIKTYKFDKQNFRFCQSDKDNKGQDYFVNLRAYDYYSLGNFVIKPQPPLYPEGANVTVAYYRSEEDALADENRIPEDTVTKYPIKMGESSDLVWSKVVMKEGFGCSASNASSFYATLGTSPEVEYYPIESRLQLCKNSDNGEVSDLTLGVTNKDHLNRDIKVTWQKREFDATSNSYWFRSIKTIETAPFEYNVTEAGTYRALVDFKKEPFGLSKEDETNENEKPAEGVTIVSCNVNNVWTVEDFMSVVVENTDSTGMINSLDVNEQGQAAVVIGLASGTTSGYEFRIDTGAFQPSSHFYNVPIGEHTAWVRDIASGCSAFTTFSVFGYPKFFTPNGDGYNDTWNIPGLQGHPEARIYIYDRYGKLIKQMSPQGEGWDGTFNGKQLPSTDYWFTVEFTTDFVANKELDGRKVSYKGHFSLKR